jgi:hypothetical protein
MAPTDERFGPAGNEWAVVHASTEERESSFCFASAGNGETPYLGLSRNSAAPSSVWRETPTASPSVSSFSRFCEELVSFFVSFLVSIFRAAPMEGGWIRPCAWLHLEWWRIWALAVRFLPRPACARMRRCYSQPSRFRAVLRTRGVGPLARQQARPGGRLIWSLAVSKPGHSC